MSISNPGFETGARATIEGQTLPLCIFAGTFYPSGSFQWAAMGNFSDARNIVQVGYGRCLNTNNSPGNIICDGNYHWYWAWGSACGGPVDGSYPGVGPGPLRIGPALSNPPPTRNVYVIRHLVNGVIRYEGFVNGVLLTGVGANGATISASVPASQICWDGDNSLDRHYVWFGEVFNPGDSMGGWTGSTANNLDYTAIRYSQNTGWLSPGFTFPVTCNSQNDFPPYRCKRTAADQLFITTTR